jgi:hypothetical protein
VKEIGRGIVPHPLKVWNRSMTAPIPEQQNIVRKRQVSNANQPSFNIITYIDSMAKKIGSVIRSLGDDVYICLI